MNFIDKQNYITFGFYFINQTGKMAVSYRHIGFMTDLKIDS